MTPSNAHASAETLADLLDDDLPVDRSAAIRAHLASCPSCQTTYEQLRDLPALLAAMPPPPVPDDVTARVMAAIEREQQARAASAVASPAAGAPARRRFLSGLREGLGVRLAAGVLGVAAVFGVGYVVVQGMAGGASDTAGGSPQDFAEADSGADGSVGHAPDVSPRELSDSGLAYGAATLQTDVQELLAQQNLRSPATDDSAPNFGGGAPGPRAEPDRCVIEVQSRAGSNAEPLAVDMATYEGEPAVVVVLPKGGADSDQADVWVLARTCLTLTVGGSVGGEADVLARATVTR